METLKIEILNPKVKKLLKDLADMKLIKIEKQVSLKEILSKFRNSQYLVLSTEDIASEVKAKRTTRNAKNC
jgi:predicted transcriptional regulator